MARRGRKLRLDLESWYWRLILPGMGMVEAFELNSLRTQMRRSSDVAKRQEGLHVRAPRRRKRAGPSTHAPVLIAQAPNVMWRSNFQYDSTTDGRLIKFLSACPHLTPTC
jgi:hypothetical protein